MEPSSTLGCLTSTLEVKRRASNIVMFNVISTCNLDIGAVEAGLEVRCQCTTISSTCESDLNKIARLSPSLQGTGASACIAGHLDTKVIKPAYSHIHHLEQLPT